VRKLNIRVVNTDDIKKALRYASLHYGYSMILSWWVFESW